MSSHSNLSPSKAHRFMACPGSIREEAKYPEQEGGPAAIDGTHSHTLLENCIIGDLADPGVAVGHTVKDHEGAFTVDADRAARVRVAIEYIKSRGKELGEGCEVIPEQKVNPEHFLGRKDLSGTADIQILAPAARVLEVIDYKDGMVYVPVEENPQLELYGIGALAAFKLPVNGKYPFDTVRLTVVQPKLALKGGKAVNWVEMPVRALLDKIGKYVLGAAKTDLPDALLVPGESQCKYCRAKGSCAALANSVMGDVGLLFAPIATQITEVTEIAQQAADKDPAKMDDQQIRQIMEAAPLMRQLLIAVETEALRRFKAGVSIPGLKAVYGRGSRSWTLNEQDTADKLIKMGMPKSVVYEVNLISPAKAEKATWETSRNGAKVKKQLTDRQLKTMATEYVLKVAGKLTIVSESDERQAVALNAAPLFGAVQSPVVETLPAWLM